MSYLSIILRPKEDECIAGYILRLAKINGIVCLTELMSRHQLTHICRGNGILFEKTLNEYGLADIIKPLRKSRGDTSLSTCKICPACVLSSMPVLESWQKPTSYHCETHKVLLVENCPRCSSALKWEIPILSANCTNEYCEAQLPIRPSPLAALSRQALEECYAAAQFANHVKNAYSSLSSVARIELGYEVLTQSKTYLPLLSEYLKQKADYVMYPITFRLWELLHCINSLTNEWPFTRMVNEAISVVRHDDKDGAQNIPELFVPHAVLIDYLSKLTKSPDYPAFIKQYTHKKAVSTEGVRSEHFSISPLLQILKSSSTPHTEQAFSLGNWLSIIAPYHIEAIDVVNACCRGELRYRFQSSLKLVDSLLILEIDMRNFVFNYFEKNDQNYISSEIATKLCSQPIELLQKAKRTGLLRTYRVNNFSPRQFLKREVMVLARVLNKQLSLPISEHASFEPEQV
ncbi:hypothetical protein [Rheinheimera pleomorphica]|uniref:hypothetical protein n=1 Tax=Rheinheimera pleomorphica TaxID=2703963 RepID=UPI001421501D|nr:hypothetical protein [Rheinheimera pleomorphica]